MTDLLDGDEFYALMEAYGEAWLKDRYNDEIPILLADVKNYIRIHCVVPQTNEHEAEVPG